MIERVETEAERQKTANAADTHKLLLYFQATYGGHTITVSPSEKIEQHIFSAALRFGIKKREIDFVWTDEGVNPTVELVTDGEKEYVKISLSRKLLSNMESKLLVYIPGGTLPPVNDKTYYFVAAISRARRAGVKIQGWDNITEALAQAYQLYQKIESDEPPTLIKSNYAEMPPGTLLARVATALKHYIRPAADQINQMLPDENREEFRLPGNPPHLALAILAKGGALYRIHYFAKPMRYPVAGTYEVRSQNEIIIEECELQEGTELEWESLRLTDTLAVRRKGTAFLPKMTAVFRKNRLISGDASLLARAAEALDDAFLSWEASPLDDVVEILWGTKAEPEKPVRPTRGKFPNQRGGRGKLARVPVPIDDPKIRRR